jgi:isocitrate/isopropylmalate dehydrogenase
MRLALETAKKRSGKLLIVVTKSNSLRNGKVLWDEVAKEVSKNFPDVKGERYLLIPWL